MTTSVYKNLICRKLIEDKHVVKLKGTESYFSFYFLIQKFILYAKIAISQKKLFSQIQF